MVIVTLKRELSMNNDLLIKLVKSTNEYISEFRENPYHYLLERDIQCALFSKLRNRINQKILVKGINQPDYELNLINSEYLNSIDIACLDPEAINNLSSHDTPQENGKDLYIYHLPILLGIELKYIWMGQNRGVNIFLDDVVKFRKYNDVNNRLGEWLSICFIQDEETVEKHLLKLSSSHSYDSVQNIGMLNEQYIVGPRNTYIVNTNA